MSKIQISSKDDYLKSSFNNDKETRAKMPVIKTGIKSLDEQLQIRNGVHLVGGLPSAGKTTLLVQLADTFASQGHETLFFSLEQNEYDLTIKSLNRIKNQYSLSDEEALNKYNSFADHIKTVTSTGSVTIDELCTVVRDFVSMHKKKPIIFIDYLQLLRTSKKLAKREEIEEISHQIINLSKEFGLTIFVLSSLSRANYLSPIDLESFKESGSLEYDADVVLGLQYQLIRESAFVNTTSVDKKRLMLAQEKSKPTRRVELVCIKNRFGEMFDSCKLDYTPQKDLFTEQITPVDKKQKNAKIL